jgi:hypothetical protein
LPWRGRHEPFINNLDKNQINAIVVMRPPYKEQQIATPVWVNLIENRGAEARKCKLNFFRRLQNIDV